MLHDKVDLKTLNCTALPYYWELYLQIVSITPITKSGRSLIGASAFLLGAKIKSTHRLFWYILSTWLSMDNHLFIKKLNIEREKNK